MKRFLLSLKVALVFLRYLLVFIILFLPLLFAECMPFIGFMNLWYCALYILCKLLDKIFYSNIAMCIFCCWNCFVVQFPPIFTCNSPLSHIFPACFFIWVSNGICSLLILEMNCCFLCIIFFISLENVILPHLLKYVSWNVFCSMVPPQRNVLTILS